MLSRRHLVAGGAALAGLAASGLARAQAAAPIKIGTIMPFSGPASSYGTMGQTEVAYFKMINEQGGINGRPVEFIAYDDGYSPPKTVERARQLVEHDQVLAILSPIGTAGNTAIRKYMNSRKVPHLFVGSGASKWGDPRNFPWTMGWQPTYATEGGIYARYVLEKVANPKIAILYQNDDVGKDYLKGFKDALGAKASALVVAEASYEITDTVIFSQLPAFKASGANVLLLISLNKATAQVLRGVRDINWDVEFIVSSVGTSVVSALQPVGLDRAKGVVSAFYAKDPADVQWQEAADYKEWLAFMQKYYPSGNVKDLNNAYGYAFAVLMTQVLRQCGSEVTRENIMRQAADLKEVELPMLLPGIRINTSPTDFFPIEQMRMARFDGEKWALFGDLLSPPRA